MIFHTTYKNRPAIGVKGDRLTALFLPEDGGKMSSLTDGKREYLAQAPGQTYNRLLPNGDYTASECSGFDDLFPTVDRCEQNGIVYPDHGEICRYPMETVTTDDCLSLSYSSKILPVRFRKTVSVGWNKDGAIILTYEINNESRHEVSFLWAAHCMLAAEPDAEILHPYPPDAPIKTMFGKQLSRNKTEPFSCKGESYKYYFTNTALQGYCGYRYGDGKALILRYPPQIIKYLGIWINNGSFKGMYNIALEPCTAPYDSPAAAQSAGCGCFLKPHGSVRFELSINLEE